MKLKRRDFLAGAAALAGSAFIGQYFYESRQGFLISSCRRRDGKSCIASVNMNNSQIRTSGATSFEPHSFTQVSPYEVVGIEKHGPHFLLYDFHKNEITRIFSAPKGYVINGHAALLKNQILLSFVLPQDSYALRTSQSGILMPFDLKTMRYGEPLNCFGYGPHDVKIVRGSLIVANSNGPEGLSVLSVFKPGEKSPERVYPAPENYSFRHIFPGQKDVIFALSEVGNESHIGCSYAYLPDHQFESNTLKFFHFMKSRDGKSPIDHSSFTRMGDHGFLCVYQKNAVAKFDVSAGKVTLLEVNKPQGVAHKDNQLLSFSCGNLDRIDRKSGKILKLISENKKIGYFSGHTFQGV